MSNIKGIRNSLLSVIQTPRSKKLKYHREYYQQNKERMKRQIYEAASRPESIVRRKETSKEYYKKNREKILAYKKERMKDSGMREHVREYNKRWYQKNRERVLEKDRQRYLQSKRAEESECRMK